MSSELLTHKALAELLGVSETTVKSYRRKFPGCIPVANQGKPIRFTPEAAAVALRIRDLFATGMSVEEVRRRLATEFAWIPAQAPEDAPAKSASDPASPAIAPELTLGVSNMAKSMVTITGQQKTILERVKGIESALEDMGISGVAVSEEERHKKAEAARLKEERLEARLAQLDAVTQDLAGSLAVLAEQFGKFVVRQQGTAPQGHASAIPAPSVTEAAHPAGEAVAMTNNVATPGAHSEQPAQAAPQPHSHSGQGPAPHGEEAQAHSAQSPHEEPGPEALRPLPMEAPVPAEEPARPFFLLRLIVRMPDGTYASVGGRSRGRFSLEDFKALLAHRYPATRLAPLRFAAENTFWRMQATLPEEEAPVQLELLLEERMTHKGFAVVEVAELKVNNRAVHPSEVCNLIDTLVG